MPPKQQVVQVGWHESGSVQALGGKLEFVVRTIRIGPRGWSVDGSIRNQSPSPVSILPRAHLPQRTGLGMIVTHRRSLDELPPGAAPAVATKVRPLPPVAIRPGQSWSGSFSGPHRLAAGTFVHVVFGDLGTPNAHRLVFITDHAYRVR